MYEDQTFDVIEERMLSRVNNALDKRTGSVIYDATAPASAELAQMYIYMDNQINELFADTASREYLIRRAAERGLSPEEATYAVGIGTFTGADVPLGSRFSGTSYNWVVTEITNGVYYLTCETAGSDPNSDVGCTLIPIEYISGLETAVLSSIEIYGEDEEDTETFRQRYYDSFESEAFGGNKKDYYDKVTSIDGVGGCKVYRATNAAGETVGGYVLLVITDSEYGVPTDTLISTVQETIDPTQDGEGEGLAPIGHIATVQAATGKSIDISTTITYASGYDFTSLESYICAAIDEYFLELNKTWGNSSSAASECITIRISAIESRLLDVTGITDVADTTLNGSSANVTLGEKEIAVRGEVVG